MVTVQDARQKLLATRDGLVQEQAQLLARLTDAAEREEAARVQALTADPEHRSDAKGAASPVRKIQESTRRDEERLTNVENEIRAVDVRLEQIDEEEADRVHADRVKADARLRQEEQVAIDAFTAAARVLLDEHAKYLAVVERRRDELGGGSEFPPLLDASRTRSAVEMFAAVTDTRVPEFEERSKPRPDDVVRIFRSDPRWPGHSRVGVSA